MFFTLYSTRLFFAPMLFTFFFLSLSLPPWFPVFGSFRSVYYFRSLRITYWSLHVTLSSKHVHTNVTTRFGKILLQNHSRHCSSIFTLFPRHSPTQHLPCLWPHLILTSSATTCCSYSEKHFQSWSTFGTETVATCLFWLMFINLNFIWNTMKLVSLPVKGKITRTAEIQEQQTAVDIICETTRDNRNRQLNLIKISVYY